MLGVVLAGGQSRRMGRDKALVTVDGEALWRRQERMLRRAGAWPIVVVRRPDQPSIGARSVCDVFQGCGPLAGLHAALALGGAEHLAVVAVDMPGVDAAWFLRLRGFCRPGAGAVMRHAQSLEPLAAIYPAEALAGAEERLQRRELSVRRFVTALIACGRMVAVPLASEDRGAAVSLNAPPA